VTARNVTMGAPFGWLMRALDVGRRNPGALFGGFLLVLVVGLVPSAIQLAGDAVAEPFSAGWTAAYAVSVLVSLLLMPPLVGAAFRLLHACESGAPARATDIFAAYRDRGFALRTVLLALAFMAVYLVALGALYVVLPGKETLVELFQRVAATPPGGQPDLSGLPAPPGGLLLWLLGTIGLLLLLGNAYMLAFAQVALGGRGIADALRDGFAGAFRNLLPFIGFALAAFFVGMVVLLIAAVVIGVVIALLAAVSPTLAVVVAIPLYLALMLGLYVVAFGFYYHAWREIFSAPGVPADGPALDGDTLAA
jgi:hypothetical protein